MKHLILWAVVIAAGIAPAAQSREHEQQWRPYIARDEGERDRSDRFGERRERMRALREEMQRSQPRPPRYREEEMHRPAPDRREFERPGPSREWEQRRLSPEERRQFRRQLHDAGRDVYRN